MESEWQDSRAELVVPSSGDKAPEEAPNVEKISERRLQWLPINAVELMDKEDSSLWRSIMEGIGNGEVEARGLTTFLEENISVFTALDWTLETWRELMENRQVKNSLESALTTVGRLATLKGMKKRVIPSSLPLDGTERGAQKQETFGWAKDCTPKLNLANFFTTLHHLVQWAENVPVQPKHYFLLLRKAWGDNNPVGLVKFKDVGKELATTPHLGTAHIMRTILSLSCQEYRDKYEDELKSFQSSEGETIAVNVLKFKTFVDILLVDPKLAGAWYCRSLPLRHADALASSGNSVDFRSMSTRIFNSSEEEV